MKIALPFTAFALLGLLAACNKQPAKTTTAHDPCGSLLLTYTADIKPIIDSNCAGCHSAVKKAGGIDLSSYAAVKETAGKRSFLGSIKHEAGFSPMPKKREKLDEQTLQKITCWVKKGSPE